MRIELPRDQVIRLKSALARAGAFEIGGQLFGEQVAPSNFKVTELTVQKRVGSFSRFIVDLIQVARDALKFFDKTGHRYTKFNYIGEWHSHPSFAVKPSSVDVETMRTLVHDPAFRGSFAVLMIFRLDYDELLAGAWLFDPAGAVGAVDLEMGV